MRFIVVEFNGPKGWEVWSEAEDKGPGSASRITAASAADRIQSTDGFDVRITFEAREAPEVCTCPHCS